MQHIRNLSGALRDISVPYILYYTEIIPQVNIFYGIFFT